jgi:syntaxin 16
MASAAPSFLGTARNLTDKFLRFRNQAKDTGGFGYSASREDLARERASARLLDAAIGSSSSGDPHGVGSSGIAGMSSTLPPAWVDFSEEASGDISSIREKLRELSSAHAKALLPTFDDIGGAEDHVVEVVTSEITRLFKRCEGKLKRLGDRVGGSDSREEDLRVVANVRTKLATELHGLSIVFRKAQKEYLQRLQQQEGRGPGGAGVDDIFSSHGDQSGSGGARSYAILEDPGFSEQQLKRVDRAEAVSLERDSEVVNILRSVNDLAGVMKDLSVLIIDQGTVLDRIDYNCEMVAVTVEEGRKQLSKAEEYQKNSRLILCIYFLAAMVGVMALVVIFQKMD